MWYFEREIERWELACEQDGTDRLIILDGDPYQPVWFNWIYPELAKFERYATMLGPQMAYFDALGQRFPGLVYSQEAAELKATALCSLDRHPTAVDTAQVFSFMRSWLGSHNPDDF